MHFPMVQSIHLGKTSLSQRLCGAGRYVCFVLSTVCLAQLHLRNAHGDKTRTSRKRTRETEGKWNIGFEIECVAVKIWKREDVKRCKCENVKIICADVTMWRFYGYRCIHVGMWWHEIFLFEHAKMKRWSVESESVTKRKCYVWTWNCENTQRTWLEKLFVQAFSRKIST